MEYIKNTIERYLKKRKIGKFLSLEKINGQKILDNWEKIIGEEYGKFTQPHKFLDNKLFIYVKNSVIISELIYKKKEIIEKINKEFSIQLKDIIFKIKQ